MLETRPGVDPKSIRVGFIRLGAFSLDVEGVAYLYARDWDHFLELQEQLLFGITEMVERAGAGNCLSLRRQCMSPNGKMRWRRGQPSILAGGNTDDAIGPTSSPVL